MEERNGRERVQREEGRAEEGDEIRPAVCRVEVLHIIAGRQ